MRDPRADCDDADPAFNPGATEADCTDPSDDAGEAITDCTAPEGYAAASEVEDCDDTDASVYPGADDPAGDEVDQDCDVADSISDEPQDTGDGSVDAGDKAGGCGCATPSPSGGWAWLGLLGVLFARRRAG